MIALVLPMTITQKLPKYIIFMPIPKTYTNEQLEKDVIELSNFLEETLPGNLYNEFVKHIAGKVE